jgi:TPP-dependent 2-oxoacid decarboxylase
LVDVPDTRLELKLPESDPERLESAARHIAGLLNRALHPALLVDIEVDRSGIAKLLSFLVDKRQIPYAALRTGKAILSETHPLFMGVYMGEASTQMVKDVTKGSDCLIVTEPCFIEGSPMVFPGGLPVKAHVYMRGYSVTVENEVYEGVTAADLVNRLIDMVKPCPAIPTPQMPLYDISSPKSGAALTHFFLWSRIEKFIRSGDVVIADNGTSNIAMTDVKLPENTKYISQLVWGAIGYSLPALLGSMMAAPDRRHILFIGDGSFQMTVQELSTILKRGLKPFIFLINNRGYTIERFILGMNEEYNNIANWQYSALPGIFTPDIKSFTAIVETENDLEKVLANIEDINCACLIELCLDPEDAPEALKIFGPYTAELDYGPRGPQRIRNS